MRHDLEADTNCFCDPWGLQDRWAVESAVQQLKDEQMRAESMQREVQDLSQVAQERQDELRYAWQMGMPADLPASHSGCFCDLYASDTDHDRVAGPFTACRATQEQLRSLTDEHSRLVPQIEQLKWQIRQGQKRTEEMQTNHAEALQVGRCMGGAGMLSRGANSQACSPCPMLDLIGSCSGS